MVVGQVTSKHQFFSRTKEGDDTASPCHGGDNEALNKYRPLSIVSINTIIFLFLSTIYGLAGARHCFQEFRYIFTI